MQVSSAKTTDDLQSQLATLEESLEAEKERGSALERSLRESLAMSEDKVVELQVSTTQLREDLTKTRYASERKADEQQFELTKLEQDLKKEKERAMELDVSGQYRKTESDRTLADLERSSAGLKAELANATSTASENVLKLQSDITRLEHELQTEKEQASNLQNVHDSHKTDAESKAATLEITIAGLHDSLAKANSSADEKIYNLQAEIAKLEHDLQIERGHASITQADHNSQKNDAQSKAKL